MIVQKDKQEELNCLHKSFDLVFKNNDPFDAMFQPTIEKRLLLYPTDGYVFTREQFDALIHTLEKMGETSFYVSEIEGKNSFSADQMPGMYQCKHWEVQLPISYDEYVKSRVIIENAIYSVEGKWGIIISQEEHAVLGGSSNFIETFKTLYPLWQQDSMKFLDHWEYCRINYGTRMDWLQNFLDHIGGKN